MYGDNLGTGSLWQSIESSLRYARSAYDDGDYLEAMEFLGPVIEGAMVMWRRMVRGGETLGALEPHSNQLEPSRWHELFGTPERAARTLHHNGTLVCRECLVRDECKETLDDSDCIITNYDALLEWLRGDA